MNCPNSIGKGTRLLKCSILTDRGENRTECNTQRFCPSRGKYINEQFTQCPLYQDTITETKIKE